MAAKKEDDGGILSSIGKGYNWLQTHTLTGAEIKDPKPDFDRFGANKKLKYKPDDRNAQDKRSVTRKVWDELKGETVGGNPIRIVDRSGGGGGGAVPVKPGKKGPKPSATVKASKATVATVPQPQKKQRMQTVQSWRTGGSDFRYEPGTKPNYGPKSRGGVKASSGVHDTKGLKWFRGKD